MKPYGEGWTEKATGLPGYMLASSVDPGGLGRVAGGAGRGGAQEIGWREAGPGAVPTPELRRDYPCLYLPQAFGSRLPVLLCLWCLLRDADALCDTRMPGPQPLPLLLLLRLSRPTELKPSPCKAN